jgi:hypothetical protein
VVGDYQLTIRAYNILSFYELVLNITVDETPMDFTEGLFSAPDQDTFLLEAQPITTPIDTTVAIKAYWSLIDINARFRFNIDNSLVASQSKSCKLRIKNRNI